jgi:SnoaL-like protein
VIDEQAWLAAWSSERAGPIIAIADPEVEVHAVALGTEGRHYEGHDGLRQWMRDVGERFHARARADSLERLGDDAVMVRGTLFMPDDFGGEQQLTFALVIHLRDDKALWVGTFFSAAEAKAAYKAGVTGPEPG